MLERGDALAGQRVGARIAIVLRDVHPEFEILEPLEEGERAAAADPGPAEDSWRRPASADDFLDRG